MSHTFRTLSEAVAAGYTRGERVKHRGFVIYPRDVSGGNSFGYHFAVRVQPEVIELNDDEPRGDLCERDFGRAVSVWLSEDLNAIRQPGVFSVRFAPGVWQAGVEAARVAIDAYYAASPRAAARQAAVEADWAVIRERQAAKAAARGAIRAEKRARRDAAAC